MRRGVPHYTWGWAELGGRGQRTGSLGGPHEQRKGSTPCTDSTERGACEKECSVAAWVGWLGPLRCAVPSEQKRQLSGAGALEPLPSTDGLDIQKKNKAGVQLVHCCRPAAVVLRQVDAAASQRLTNPAGLAGWAGLTGWAGWWRAGWL